MCPAMIREGVSFGHLVAPSPTSGDGSMGAIGVGLDLVHLGVSATLAEQAFVVSLFDDVALVEHDDVIGGTHGREPVGYEQGDAAVGSSLPG